MERSNSSTSSPAEAVKVVVRCRPMNEKEVAENYQRVVNVFPTRGTVEITNPQKPDSKREFTFDTVYDWNSSQKELFEESVKPLVDSVLQGYNGTIFAYGQTGTGKTYTMEGIAKDAEQQGLIPRSFSHIFNHISQSCDRQFLVRASYMEIYQEQIKDLLAKDQKKSLEMREHPDKGVYIKDLSSFVCKSVGEIEHVMNVGNQNRSIGATNMNEHSSRSHAIFMITIESCSVCPGQTDGKNSSIVVGKLNMVDLAGSERQAKTGAVGDRLKEATKINLSLSALGNVISALVDSKTSHVPYRDSKLTRLLQDSLGGNSRTVMVANVGPASYNYEESLTTLRYANRAKHIRNKPQINEDPKDALIRSFQEEIARLKAHLEMKKMRNKKKIGGPQSPDDESGAEWSAKEAALEQEKKDILNNRSLIAEEKERLLQVLTTKQAELNKKREDQEKLATRVAALESKLLTGTATMAAVSPNTSFEDVTKQQKLTLEKRRQEIIERERREREMRQQLEAQDEEVLDFKENFTSLQQEIEYKTRKLRKMYAKWQSVKQEMSDLSAEFRQQRQELEQAQEVLLKELRLKQVLINHFIPTDFKQQMMARATYDDEEEKWVLKPSTQAPMLPLICSSKLDLRPTSEYEKHSRLSEDQSAQMGQFRFENILLLGLDIPPRSTKDYVAPEVSPTLQAALTEALHNRNAVVQVEARKFSSGADIHAFLKSACGRKLNQRSKSRNKLNSPSHKRHPQGYTPDGTSAAVQASYPRTRGLIPK